MNAAIAAATAGACIHIVAHSQKQQQLWAADAFMHSRTDGR